MDDDRFKVWAALKILELREAMGNNNSFFTTIELDMLFKIRDENKPKNTGKIIKFPS